MPHRIFYCNLNPAYTPKESLLAEKNLRNLEAEVEECEKTHLGSRVKWLQSTGSRYANAEAITQITAIVSW